MYELKITRYARRYIGDRLLGVDYTTASISGISSMTGVSRATLTKWTRDARRLYWLTKHIGDGELVKLRDRYLSRWESRFFDNAQEYCRAVRKIRDDALAGVYGEKWQREERDRKRREVRK